MLTASIVFGITHFIVNSSPSFSFSKSGRIPLDTATKYREDFVKSDILKVTHRGQGDTLPVKTETLEGFVFNASDLIEIIEKNRSGKTPTEVIFYFGQNGRHGGLFNTKYARIQIIAIGKLDDELLTQDTMKGRDEPSIFDKADPCPPFCGKIKTE